MSPIFKRPRRSPQTVIADMSRRTSKRFGKAGGAPGGAALAGPEVRTVARPASIRWMATTLAPGSSRAERRFGTTTYPPFFSML